MSEGTGNKLPVKWADQAMFEAAPMQRDDLGRVTPQVTLLSATPDPLGAIAAACRMYEGKPTYDLSDITDDERRHYWQQSLDTHLKAPWEFVDFHFFIEAVTRSFTHQMVRQRTAVYAQESLRFAVKEGFADEVPKPPSLVNGAQELQDVWDGALVELEAAYQRLVNAGIPAEDARGLLPHAVTTRLNYKTNLRNMLEVAGNRLCTQAGFEWRGVFLEIIRSIQGYSPPHYDESIVHFTPGDNSWQFELIGTPIPGTFTPVCYKMGKCPYMAVFDRQCTIRGRVNAFGEAGVPAAEWGHDHDIRIEPQVVPGTGGETMQGGQVLFGIDPAEWMADPTAGRRD